MQKTGLPRSNASITYVAAIIRFSGSQQAICLDAREELIRIHECVEECEMASSDTPLRICSGGASQVDFLEKYDIHKVMVPPPFLLVRFRTDLPVK